MAAVIKMKACFLIILPTFVITDTLKREANYHEGPHHLPPHHQDGGPSHHLSLHLDGGQPPHLPLHLEGGPPPHHLEGGPQPHHLVYPTPLPPSYPDHNIIQTGYPGPQPLHLDPPHQALYGHHPSHNCTVEDEVLSAEICTPTYAPSCSPFPVQGTKLGHREKCMNIVRTVCTQTKEKEKVRVCLVDYAEKLQTVSASSVQVKFDRSCQKQMVTVCEPQPYRPGYQDSYHSVQHCREVGQETCYNVPRLEASQIQVEISLPEPVEKCQTRDVEVPSVECKQVTDKTCVNLPSIETIKLEANACVPVVSQPKCDKVELVLPKQVCRELLYGYAEKPIHKYKEVHHKPNYVPKPTYVPKPAYVHQAKEIKYLGKKIDKEPERDLQEQITKIPESYVSPE